MGSRAVSVCQEVDLALLGKTPFSVKPKVRILFRQSTQEVIFFCTTQSKSCLFVCQSSQRVSFSLIPALPQEVAPGLFLLHGFDQTASFASAALRRAPLRLLGAFGSAEALVQRVPEAGGFGLGTDKIQGDRNQTANDTRDQSGTRQLPLSKVLRDYSSWWLSLELRDAPLDAAALPLRSSHSAQVALAAAAAAEAAPAKLRRGEDVARSYPPAN